MLDFVRIILNYCKKFDRRFRIDSATARFIAHNRAKWRSSLEAKNKSVILVDIFDSTTQIYIFSAIANYIARRTNSSIGSYIFARGFLDRLGLPQRRLEKIYASFGARLVLSYRGEHKYARKAREFAERTISELKTKQDVLEIQIDGVKIGAFIYDTYLRAGRPTVNLSDPAFRKVIYDAYIVFQNTKDYFSRVEVKALLVGHAVYISNGIICAIAASHNIPMFVIVDDGSLKLAQIGRETLYHIHYDEFKKTFAGFKEELKSGYREIARKQLESRLSGKLDSGISYMVMTDGAVTTGYGEHSKAPLFEKSDRPKIVVLLSCFFDAPHGYRWLLFPDFWEWITFLLDRASETAFDWYVKPHPGGLPGNDRIFEKLKGMYPKIKFLRREASNTQLVAEGVRSMFTVYGTAAHEFAYLGVPVVNAGDNPHIDYDFNFHPRTINEYEQFIKNADRLQLDIRKTEIEELFYMQYHHVHKKNDFGARLIDEEFSYAKIGSRVNSSALFDDLIRTETLEKDEKVRLYFDQFFEKKFPKK